MNAQQLTAYFQENYDRLAIRPEQQDVPVLRYDDTDIMKATAGLAAYDLQAIVLDPRAYAQMNTVLEETPQLKKMRDWVRGAFEDVGACIVALKPEIFSFSYDDYLTAMDIVVSTVGESFGPFTGAGRWQTIGVSYKAAPGRAESLEDMPPHLDFNQASIPPKGIQMLCLRKDPRGGGTSTLLDYTAFLMELPETVRVGMAQYKYSYTPLFNTHGIGEDCNPHPLLSVGPRGGLVLRYNAKALPLLPEDGADRELFRTLAGIFHARSHRHLLQPGEILFINQDKMLHGRDALGSMGWHPPTRDRFLWQTCTY